MIYTQFINHLTLSSCNRMKNIDPYVLVLGRAIASERKKRQLTQTQLAHLTNSSINFISQIESGKARAQIGKVLEVLKVLGLELHIEKGSKGVVNEIK